MINNKILVLSGFILIIVISGAVFYKGNRHFSLSLFNSEEGWGYNILYNNKLIIHQPYMPAINGQVVFKNKYTARKTGRLVIKKLQKNQSPGITVTELNSIVN